MGWRDDPIIESNVRRNKWESDPLIASSNAAGASPLTGTDGREISSTGPTELKQDYPLRRKIMNFVRPLFSYGGAALSAIPGAAGGTLLGGGPVGTVAGGAALAGVGYAGGQKASDIFEEGMGWRQPKPLGEQFVQTGKDIATGATAELAGLAGGKIVGKGLEYLGKGSKQLIGATTGMGTGAVDEALKGSPAFKSAMRGQTGGDEIVSNAKTALQAIKDQRATAYQEKLKEVVSQQGNIDITPIKQKMQEIMGKYNVKILPDGIDSSRVAMGKTGRKDIEEVIKTVNEWGSKEGDNTAVGLDVLKRQLDDFYSDSSQARGFVSTLRNAVRDTISKNVPQYGEMTKGYSEATALIKDIESNLMLRKEGMSGHITADQTLRRLTSAMRDNFEMRRDLVNVLGTEGGQDIAGQVAGYAASPIIPRGLIGRLAGGGAGYFVYMHPKFWPLLAASSPRVMGEFLNVYGKALGEVKGSGAAIGGIASKLGILGAVGRGNEQSPPTN